MYVLLRMVNYGIHDKYCGINDIALYLQSEVDEHEGQAVEKGLDIAIDSVKENDDYENDGKINPYKRSIKIEGDVKASLAAKPLRYLLKDE